MNTLAPWAADTRDEQTLKDAFAEALLRAPNEPFQAALSVVGKDTIRAVQIANDWVSDSYVLKKQIELIKELGDDYFLPSKATLARRVFDLGEKVTATINERLAAYRLYADLRSFIEKPAMIQDNRVTLTQNKVMVVENFGTDEQWEKAANDQQMKLVSNARD